MGKKAHISLMMPGLAFLNSRKRSTRPCITRHARFCLDSNQGLPG